MHLSMDNDVKIEEWRVNDMIDDEVECKVVNYQILLTF